MLAQRANQAGVESAAIDSEPYGLYASLGLGASDGETITQRRRGSAQSITGVADGCAARPTDHHHPAWAAGRCVDTRLRKQWAKRPAVAAVSRRQRSRVVWP